MLSRPWLDVLYYAQVLADVADEEREALAMMIAVATWEPGMLMERREAKMRAQDTRTADEIWQDLLAAEARGWRQ